MSTLLQLASNATVAKIINADREVKLILSDLMSYAVEGAEFSQAFKSGGWDGRSSFFDYKQGTFPAGFASGVQAELMKRGYRVQTVKRKLPEALGVENPIVDAFGNDDPRYDYQMETVRQLLKRGMMIARVATGGGKSKIAKLCVARIKRPTLFITTRGVLMYQMKEGFEEAGMTVGVMGDSEWTPRRGVNVAMIQTLISRLEDKSLESFVESIVSAQFNAQTKQIEDLKLSMAAAKVPVAAQAARLVKLCEQQEKARLSDAAIAKLATEKHKAHHHRRAQTIKIMEIFEFVIGEEAHEAGGNSYFEVLRHCKNAVYRLALTATPFMKADAESNMRLMAAFGPIGIEISEKRLIDSGILARPYFKFVDVPAPKLLKKSTPWQRAYKLGIVENVHRNQAIVFEAHRAAQYGLPVMVLVQHKAHGKILKDLLETAGVRTDFIFGESDQTKRRNTLNALRDGKINCLIGSTILDVGVDVPAVGMVILAGGGKAEVALRQRIGRGLRAKKSGPNIAFVVDFNDPYNGHLRDHARERFSIISSTPGFVENIIPAGGDFNFSKLGFKVAA